MITNTYSVHLDGVGPVDVTVSEYGAGRPFLLLHGGGGPDTVARFGETLAADEQVRVLVPIHPGFGGTARPEALHTVRDLAALYVALLDQLGLDDVTVVGNSIGGWIAAEIAILNSPRVSRAILIDAAGLEVPGHPVADFFSLTMDQVFELSFHNPGPYPHRPGHAASRRAGRRRGQPGRPLRLRRPGDDRSHSRGAPARGGRTDPGGLG